VRAALGAATAQPQLVKKLEAKREAKKKQREAEASQREADKEGRELERAFAVEEMAMKRNPEDSEEESGSEEEGHQNSSRARNDSRGGGKQPTGDGSNSVVRGRLLQQISDLKAEVAETKQERDKVNNDLFSLQESFDKEVKGNRKMGKLDETANNAFQEAADQYREKLEATTAELQRIKKKLADTFSPSTLARILPDAKNEAKIKKEQAELKRKRSKKGGQEGTDSQGFAEDSGGVFSLFGGAPKGGMRSSKGVDELIATVQEQTRENKELRKALEKATKELTRHEEAYEAAARREEDATSCAQGNEGGDETPWYKKLAGGGAVQEAREGDPADVKGLQTELESLRRRLEESCEETRAAQDAAERAQAALGTGDVGGGGGEEAEPPTPGWFGKLIGAGREEIPEEEEEGVLAAIQGASTGDSRLGGGSSIGTSGDVDASILQGQIDTLHASLEGDQPLTLTLQELTNTLTRQLEAKSEACTMLSEQRSGALAQVADMQIELDKVEAQLAGVLEVRQEAGEVGEMEELLVSILSA